MAFDLKVIRKKANKITEIETEIKKKKNFKTKPIVNFGCQFL